MFGVSAVGLTILLIGSLMARQFTILVAELPQNTQNIKTKVQTLRRFGSSRIAIQFEKMAEEISEATTDPAAAETKSCDNSVAEASADRDADSDRVTSQSESIPWLSLTGYLSSAFEVLATLGFSLILLVVFLIGRDDLRDRVVVLAGRARVAVTSKALEDVTERISRYLAMVALVRQIKSLTRPNVSSSVFYRNVRFSAVDTHWREDQQE